MKTLALVAGLWLLALLGCQAGRDKAASNTITKNSPDFRLLEVVKKEGELGGFGTVGVWKITFRNRSPRSIGNIKYRTLYKAETGAVVDRGGVDSLLGEDTIQKVIQPNETRTIEINDGAVHHEAARGGFEVVSWEYVDSPAPSSK